MDGALMEVGPYRLKDEANLRYNDGSWDEFANILFVDNPVGTGFSYVDTNSYVHELTEMANQMVNFLTKFFELFPEYEDNDVSFLSVISSPRVSNLQKALHCRRILRRTAHPLHSSGHPLQQRLAFSN